MARTLRNEYDKYLTYENLMEAHNKSKKVKAYDENADYVYSKLNIGSIIWISGYIENDYIIVDFFEILI